MLLSSVSFARNCQFSDFIIGKIKEDQDKRDRRELKKLSKKEKKTDFNSNEISDRNPQEKTTEPVKFVGEEQDVTECDTVPCLESPEEPRQPTPSLITLETCDGYRFTADTVYDRLVLMEEPDQFENCHFRKQILLNKEGDDKKQQLVSFYVDSDPSCYVTATSAGSLVLKDFGEVPVDGDKPDERCFLLHQSDGGLASLQPFGKRGQYIHHFDDMLSVQKLEINWRPPEEYLFRIEIVPEVDSTNEIQCETRLSSSPSSLHTNDSQSRSQNDSNKTTEKVEKVETSANNNLKEKKDKLKTGLIKACFGWPKKKHGSDNDTLKRYSNLTKS